MTSMLNAEGNKIKLSKEQKVYVHKFKKMLECMSVN